MLSLGTGEKAFTPITDGSFSNYDYYMNIGEFMMNFETYTAHYVTMYEISSMTSSSDYLRLTTTSDLAMDKVSPKDVKNLKDAGEVMWQDNQEQVEAMLRTIIDERWG